MFLPTIHILKDAFQFLSSTFLLDTFPPVEDNFLDYPRILVFGAGPISRVQPSISLQLTVASQIEPNQRI